MIINTNRIIYSLVAIIRYHRFLFNISNNQVRAAFTENELPSAFDLTHPAIKKSSAKYGSKIAMERKCLGVKYKTVEIKNIYSSFEKKMSCLIFKRSIKILLIFKRTVLLSIKYTFLSQESNKNIWLIYESSFFAVFLFGPIIFDIAKQNCVLLFATVNKNMSAESLI